METIMDKFRLDGKKGFVTGAAQGIGRAIAEAFVQAGAELAIIDVNADKARAAAAELSARYERHITAWGCDVSDPEQVDATPYRLGFLSMSHSIASSLRLKAQQQSESC